MRDIELRGLVGTNPLGFMAALGAQIASSREGDPASLRWDDGASPAAVLRSRSDLLSVAEAARSCFDEMLAGAALGADVHPKLKFDPGDIRSYLREARAVGPTNSLAMCLVAENSLDNGGKAKPTDFYFTAGNQKFVAMGREILEGVTPEDLVNDMAQAWRYERSMSSLMWDVVDDRVYALSAFNPTDSTNNPKKTNPGAEALALLGLTRFPCFRSSRGTATRGCAGSWKRGSFTWPLWTRPASPGAVTSLLEHGSLCEPEGELGIATFRHRTAQYPGWGISQVMQSQIRRSDQGGYGTFGPAKVIWRRD